MHWGTVAEWVSGLGALSAAVAAVWVAGQAQRIAREDRRGRVRERWATQLGELVTIVERDRMISVDRGALYQSPEGVGSCVALWGKRNWFGTAWHYYCEDDRVWIDDLAANGQLWPQMRQEIVEALAKLEFEDMGPDPSGPPLRDRWLGRVGLLRKSRGVGVPSGGRTTPTHPSLGSGGRDHRSDVVAQRGDLGA